MEKKLLFGIFLFVSWSAYGMEGTESPSPEPTDCPPNALIDAIIAVQRGHIENLRTEQNTAAQYIRLKEAEERLRQEHKILPDRLRQEEMSANERQEKFPLVYPFVHRMGLCRKESTLRFLYTLPQKDISKKP